MFPCPGWFLYRGGGAEHISHGHRVLPVYILFPVLNTQWTISILVSYYKKSNSIDSKKEGGKKPHFQITIKFAGMGKWHTRSFKTYCCVLKDLSDSLECLSLFKGITLVWSFPPTPIFVQVLRLTFQSKCWFNFIFILLFYIHKIFIPEGLIWLKIKRISCGLFFFPCL